MLVLFQRRVTAWVLQHFDVEDEEAPRAPVVWRAHGGARAGGKGRGRGWSWRERGAAQRVAMGSAALTARRSADARPRSGGAQRRRTATMYAEPPLRTSSKNWTIHPSSSLDSVVGGEAKRHASHASSMGNSARSSRLKPARSFATPETKRPMTLPLTQLVLGVLSETPCTNDCVPAAADVKRNACARPASSLCCRQSMTNSTTLAGSLKAEGPSSSSCCSDDRIPRRRNSRARRASRSPSASASLARTHTRGRGARTIRVGADPSDIIAAIMAAMAAAMERQQ